MDRTGARGVCAETEKRSRGAAVVEMAVVSPILVAILLGIVEFGWTMMVRETMVNAAREGCRTAVIDYPSQSVLEEAVSNRVNILLGPLGYAVDDAVSMEMTHASDPPLPPNDMETVTLSVPFETVSLVGGFFGLESNITATCTMRKER